MVRGMSWHDVVGQEFAVRMLRAHVASGSVPNAYLLAGPEGVGKRRLALELAKALTCTGAEPPCDACQTCGQMMRGVHPDLHRLVPSGASQQIHIEDVRGVLGRLALRPFSARVQVVILEEADRLTEEAANSLLKSLEEPRGAHFVLTSSHPSACLPTIASRCQFVRCASLPAQAIDEVLRRVQRLQPEVAVMIARLSGGSATRALTLAQDWQAYGKILTRLVQTSSRPWMEEPLPDSREGVTQLLDGMIAWLRDVAMSASGRADAIDHVALADTLRAQAQAVEIDRCVETAFALATLRQSLERFVSPRLVASLAREQWLSLHQAAAAA